MKKYKAVIFDFDDTLVETRPIKWAHHKAVAKKFYNIDLTEETLRKHWGKPLALLIQELYQYRDTVENMMEANLSMREDFRKKLYKESLPTIIKILDQGVEVGILSATTKKYMLMDLTEFEFPVSRLVVVQGSDETSVHKPDPDVFLPLFAQLNKNGIQKEEIVYVGDSLDDLKAARGAGIDFIAVTTGLYSEEDFKKEGVKVIVSNIYQVAEKVI